MNTSVDRSRAFRAVIFDFDYTLADSTPGIVDCVNHAFQVLGLPPASAEAIRETVGLSIPATYERLTGEREGRRSREFRRLFVERADEVMLAGIKVFGSVKPVTEALLRDGMSLGIVSTKFRYRIEQALSRDGLEGIFAVIVGGEDVVVHKPDPTALNWAISRLGMVPADVLYVGDSTIDAETAFGAGTAFVAVLTGTTPREAFASYRVHAVIEDLAELPAVLR
jgi:phosphoglycolate phosphatase